MSYLEALTIMKTVYFEGHLADIQELAFALRGEAWGNEISFDETYSISDLGVIAPIYGCQPLSWLKRNYFGELRVYKDLPEEGYAQAVRLPYAYASTLINRNLEVMENRIEDGFVRPSGLPYHLGDWRLKVIQEVPEAGWMPAVPIK